MSLPAHLTYMVNYECLGRVALRAQRWLDERKLKAWRPKPGNKITGSLVGTARMKELMALHYLQGRYANGVRKVAWVTSGAPIEILKALDFVLIYPENHAALCGARKQAAEFCEEAEHEGYSRDLCSYARTDLGSLVSGKTPVGRLPKPDLLLCCNNICQTVVYWYRVLAAQFDVPLVVIDTPFLYSESQPHQTQFVKAQLEELIPIAEEVAGKSLSFARLKEVTKRSKDAVELWLEILNSARHRPSPLSAFDEFINMGPIVDLRGEESTIDFYRDLLAEIQQRVDRGIGAIQEEQKRVLWDNLPIWFQIGALSRMLASFGVNVIVSTYTYAWGELAPMMDPERPLESCARLYQHAFINRSTGDKLRSMKRMIDEFQLDGAILHSDRSCKPYSLGQIDQRDRLVTEAGIAALLLEADHNDPRAFSEEQARTRIEAFVEMMED